MDLLASPSIGFTEAIEVSKNFVDRLAENTLTETEIESIVASLVRSHNGARGFFVGYLTNPSKAADEPTEGIIKALKSYPEVISDLLVKNLAMSAAMTVTHQRNNALDMVESSTIVCRRSANLIEKLQLLEITRLLGELQRTASSETGVYEDFIKRWGYDREQLDIIGQTIEKALSKL